MPISNARCPYLPKGTRNKAVASAIGVGKDIAGHPARESNEPLRLADRARVCSRHGKTRNDTKSSLRQGPALSAVKDVPGSAWKH